MFHRYLYGFEDYCTSTGITFRMDLPFKALESSHTDNSVEGPAERTIIVDPKSDPEISLSTKNIIKVSTPHLTAFQLLYNTKHFNVCNQEKSLGNLVAKSLK